MITIKIKTWHCPKCGKDKRDFNPSDMKLVNKHFPGLKANECVNCREISLVKVEDAKEKIEMNIIDSQKDIDDLKARLEKEDPRVVGDVEETAKEKTERIIKSLSRVKVATSEEIQMLKDKYEDK